MWYLIAYAAVAGLTVVSLGTSLIYYLYPRLLIILMFKLYRSRSGMQVKFIGGPDFVFCYGEKGLATKDRSSILFLHGFTSSKDQWLGSFRMMGKNIHMIALDLPGHGASSIPSSETELTLEYIIEYIKKFVDLVGLSQHPFHLVGSSLGGCIAGLFAAKYPELVERISLICPGMKCPEESEFLQQLEHAIAIGAENIQIEHCSLLPQTAHELQLMLDSCMYARRNFNKQILKGAVELRIPRNDFYLRVFRVIATEKNVTILEKNCHAITMPSQVIWGANDQIIHCSGAKVLQQKLPNCQDVTIIERCGHSVDLDRPGSLVKALLKFREQDHPKKDQ